MHAPHLSARCSQTFGECTPLLSAPRIKTTRHQKSRDTDTGGTERLMTVAVTVWEVRGEKAGEERSCLVVFFLSKAPSKEEGEESRCTQRIDERIWCNQKSTEGVYQTVGYRNWEIICHPPLFLYPPQIMVQGQNKVAIADLGCKARLHG